MNLKNFAKIAVMAVLLAVMCGSAHAAGNSSGYAWSENAGWSNFAPTGGGVTIVGSGNFGGYAWGENIGWIRFANAAPAYKVVTGGAAIVTANMNSVSPAAYLTPVATATVTGTGITTGGAPVSHRVCFRQDRAEVLSA